MKGWSITKDLSFEFLKDGTYKVRRAFGPGLTKTGKKLPPTVRTVTEGTYEIDGDKLTLTPKKGTEKGKERTVQMKTLTAKTLIWIPQEGKTDELRRISK